MVLDCKDVGGSTDLLENSIVNGSVPAMGNVDCQDVGGSTALTCDLRLGQIYLQPRQCLAKTCLRYPKLGWIQFVLASL